MKLCHLFHESASCPTCGGRVDSSGKSASPSPSQLIFPDREGKWRDPETGEEIEGEPASDPRNKTQPFKQTLGLPGTGIEAVPAPGKKRRRKAPKGALQALLRYRAGLL